MHISFLKKKKNVEWICGNGIAKIGGKKKIVAIGWWQCYCRNWEKYLRQLWQCHCRKWEEKKNSGYHTNGMNGMANIAKRTTVEVAGSIIASTSFTTGMLLATT